MIFHVKQHWTTGWVVQRVMHAITVGYARYNSGLWTL